MSQKLKKGRPILFIGGSKGGTGKSIVSLSLIHNLLDAKNKTLLIETDTSNPDVYKIYNSTIDSKLINLDDADGWIDLVNISDEEKYKDHIIIINTAARNNEGTTHFGKLLNDTLPDLNRDLITFWVINRQRDSLELLKDYMAVINNTKIYVVLNTYFGSPNKFELYNSSKIKKEIEENGGTLVFPELADRVTDDIYSKRMPLSQALEKMPIGNRAELNRWIEASTKMLESVFNHG